MKNIYAAGLTLGIVLMLMYALPLLPLYESGLAHVFSLVWMGFAILVLSAHLYRLVDLYLRVGNPKQTAPVASTAAWSRRPQSVAKKRERMSVSIERRWNRKGLHSHHR